MGIIPSKVLITFVRDVTLLHKANTKFYAKSPRYIKKRLLCLFLLGEISLLKLASVLRTSLYCKINKLRVKVRLDFLLCLFLLQEFNPPSKISINNLFSLCNDTFWSWRKTIILKILQMITQKTTLHPWQFFK